MAAAEPLAARSLRADATRNRAAIVTAAAAAFAEAGSAVDVREIAQRAGVGVGTLYRHFPTKTDLLHTVLREQYAAWARAAAAAAAAQDDPWQALVGFLEDALDRQARHLAVCEDLAAVTSAPEPRCLAELQPLIDGLVARCHQADRLAAHVTSADVLLLLVALGHAARITGPDPVRCRHLVDLVLHGVASPVGGSPIARSGSAGARGGVGL